jgi:hypothetical protein
MPIAVDLGLAFGITVYDAIYVSWAMIREMVLVTANRKLAEIMRKTDFKKYVAWLGDAMQETRFLSPPVPIHSDAVNIFEDWKEGLSPPPCGKDSPKSMACFVQPGEPTRLTGFQTSPPSSPYKFAASPPLAPTPSKIC